MDIRGVYGFSSLVKQNKKAKIYAVFCFAGKKKLLFYIYAVIVKQIFYKRSSNYYYGSHRTLLAARFVARAPEGWICQRSGRVPWLVPLVMQTLLSRTRPCLRVYCKTAKPLAHRWSLFAPPPTRRPQRHILIHAVK
jgi:hypothetical protein